MAGTGGWRAAAGSCKAARSGLRPCSQGGSRLWQGLGAGEQQWGHARPHDLVSGHAGGLAPAAGTKWQQQGGAPVICPILEPAISQKRARLLFFSFFSRTSFTRWEPLRAMTAMSEVGSRIGITAWLCFVKDTRPSRKGGLVSCTISTARTSLSLVKSVSTCAAHRACSDRAFPDSHYLQPRQLDITWQFSSTCISMIILEFCPDRLNRAAASHMTLTKTLGCACWRSHAAKAFVSI